MMKKLRPNLLHCAAQQLNDASVKDVLNTIQSVYFLSPKEISEIRKNITEGKFFIFHLIILKISIWKMRI